MVCIPVSWTMAVNSANKMSLPLHSSLRMPFTPPSCKPTLRTFCLCICYVLSSTSSRIQWWQLHFTCCSVQREIPTASDASKAGLGFSLIFPVFLKKKAKKVMTFLNNKLSSNELLSPQTLEIKSSDELVIFPKHLKRFSWKDNFLPQVCLPT